MRSVLRSYFGAQACRGGLVAFCLFVPIVSGVPLMAAGPAEKQAYDLPAEDAAVALNIFSQQSGRGVIAGTDLVKGVRTNPVKGEMTPPEALSRMLDGTGLTGIEDRKSGTFAVRNKTDAEKNAPKTTQSSASDSSRKSAKENKTLTPPEPMKRNNLLTKLAALFAVATASLNAQTAAGGGNAEEEVVEMSPFVVSESSDVGWVATETLSGTRLRTDLRDVPNQIETLTKDFMQDLDLRTFEEALIYTANVENDIDHVRGADTGDNAVIFPGSGGRMRGIGQGTLSRNFFQTVGPTDNYNIERATVASGPNAILFGLGSPAGILDATPARALMRNHYGITLRYDSEDSKRGTFDANVVVVPQKLSFRLMGLSKREYTERKPNLDRNDRLYGTLTFKPFKNTTLVVQGERNSRAWNSAGRMAPLDLFTAWLNADKIPGSGYTTAKPVYDNSGPIKTDRIFQRYDVPLLIRGGSGQLEYVGPMVKTKPLDQALDLDPTFDKNKRFTILDPSVFPFDVNVMGTARTSNLDGYNKTVILEQKLADTLFLELAYNRDDANRHQLSGGGWNGGTTFSITADPNKFIPGTTTPNPHLGELYYQGTAGGRLLYYSNTDWRATLSYELDLARKLERKGAWGKWLGRHRLAGLYTGSRVENINQTGFDRRILDDPVIPGLSLRPKTSYRWATHRSRNPQFRYYLNEGAAEGLGPFQFGDWTLTDANGQPFQLYAVDTPLVAADGKRLGAGGTASGVKKKAEAMIFAWQGFFLPDREGRERLVLTYGARKDTATSAGFDAASRTRDFSGLYPLLFDARFEDYDPYQSGINRNIGIIARPFHWLSLSYNESTTFDLNVGRFDPYGNALPGAGGDGRDYGIRLDLWQNKLTLKVNKYETTLGPSRASNVIHAKLLRTVEKIEPRVLELDPDAPTINITDGNKRGFPSMGPQGHNVNSDFSGTGYEVELNFTPTRNWNIRFNGAKSEAVESNIGAVWVEWTNERLPVWQGVVAKNGEVDSADNPVTWATAPLSATNPDGTTLKEYYETTVLQGQAFVKAIDGRATMAARPSRANVIVNYRFHEGRLKGFNVGGAFRWRSAPSIGYGITTVNGETVLDQSQEYRGKAEQYVDFLAGYRGKMKAFGGMNYRLQLNIRNLLNENDPIPVAALTTGEVYRLATIDSRVYALTFGVDF